jgi:HlyD family secretion protein
VELEDREWQAQRDRAEAALLRAEAELARLRAGFRTEELDEARAQVALAEAAVRDTSATLRRTFAIVSQGAEGEQALDRARAEADRAKAQLLTAQARLNLIRAGNRSEDIRAAEATVLEAKAARDLAESQWRDTKIFAPLTGVVMERLVEPGEMVTNAALGGSRGARTALISIANLSWLEVEVDINQLDLGRARIGQDAVVGLEAFPGVEWVGRVDRIAPEANRQKATVQAKVRILNPDDRIRPEMTARVTLLEPLTTEGKEKAAVTRFFVPASAVLLRDGRAAVAVVENQRLRIRPVVRGEETPDGVRVLEGLTGQEQVVVKLPDGMGDGLPVRPRLLSRE